MVTAIRVPIHEHRDASYDVLVGRGLLGDLATLLAERCPAHRYAVIADGRVGELYGRRLIALLREAGVSVELLTFPAGEWNKTRETWAELLDALLRARFGRDSAVVALGGGVSGDLGGFVAATFQRGVPYVQAPTTLLAMIDSSVGGKTGVDVPAGKNLVGSFYQPRAVVADVQTLATLPLPHLKAGMAEAIKHGVIADRGYAEAIAESAAACCARDLDALEPLIARSVAIKASVVSADERERGRRQILNFGHTVGHAVEALSGYDLLHGEATAIGMVVEARLAEAAGLAASGIAGAISDLLDPFELPTAVPTSLGADDLMELMTRDKKVRAGAVRFALPKSLGEMTESADGAWTIEVEPDLVRETLDRCRGV